MIYALRNPGGGIWLVSDDGGLDVILDQWEHSDSQLLARNFVQDPWRPVGKHELKILHARAMRVRRDRQQRLTEGLE